MVDDRKRISFSSKLSRSGIKTSALYVSVAVSSLVIMQSVRGAPLPFVNSNPNGEANVATEADQKRGSHTPSETSLNVPIDQPYTESGSSLSLDVTSNIDGSSRAQVLHNSSSTVDHSSTTIVEVDGSPNGNVVINGQTIPTNNGRIRERIESDTGSSKTELDIDIDNDRDVAGESLSSGTTSIRITTDSSSSGEGN